MLCTVVWRLKKISKVPLRVGTLKICKVPSCVSSVLTLKIFKVLWCVGSVLCRDFENFQRSLVCGLCTVWCVETLKISIVPGVWGFEIFHSPVCGLCGVVCGDFEIFQSSPVCETLSLYWRD